MDREPSAAGQESIKDHSIGGKLTDLAPSKFSVSEMRPRMGILAYLGRSRVRARMSRSAKWLRGRERSLVQRAEHPIAVEAAGHVKMGFVVCVERSSKAVDCFSNVIK
jgi:hypothetical protein